jgi:ABC-2 type transport system ATP-binding protein
VHSDVPREIVGSPALTPLIQYDAVSKWYGNVIGINNISLAIGSGITGLLGPNGAGKSTFLQLATGQLRPSMGKVTVLGQQPWNNPGLNRHLGLCPEQDAFYEWMSGWEFVLTCAKLSGLAGRAAKDASEHAIEQVQLTADRHRAIGGYSRGMRQRIKIAQALVHQPKVLFLDEPFTGTDPVARRQLMDIIQSLAGEGKSVLLSSHVLYEVQGLTQQIVLMNRGRLVAEGNLRQIRDLIDNHPHRIVLVSAQARDLAALLVKHPDVLGLTLNDAKQSVTAETNSPDAFYARLPHLVRDHATGIHEVYSDDDNLEAVFKYLTNA